jgi:tRNA A-37 threonylcarbamoyl transferase component Bud32
VLAGRYNLLSPLARGGMAEVWEAHDEVLGRRVAVKLLAAHLADDRVFVERFRREAIAAARLSSPTIVATYDTGVDGGIPYIVMELVRGRTLRQLVNGSGPLDPSLAVAIAIQIADALVDAHRADIVHRDIKPANVLICDDEGALRVKVTDFGIAKARAGIGQDLTRTGMVLGTPKYLSPEQIEGRADVDARADLYSLGVVLFEMLAGQVPFAGTSEMAIALAHVRDQPPPVSRIRPGIEPALDALVASLLSKSPSGRPPTAAATRQALEVIARASSSPARLSLSRARNGTGADPAMTAGVAAGAPPGQRDRLRPSIGPGPGPGRADPAGQTDPGSGGRDRRPGREPGRRSAPAGERGPLGAPGPGREPRPNRPRRGRAAGTVVGAVVLAGVVVAALLLVGRHHLGRRSAETVTAVPAVQAQVYLDVTGHTLDNPGEADNVIDGNSRVGWSTVAYTTQSFGNLYGGEGLAIQLRRARRLRAIVVDSPVAGWDATTFVANRDVPTGTPVSAWGPPAGSVRDAAGAVTISLDNRTGDWVLLWLTRLGPAKQATISKVTIEAAS